MGQTQCTGPDELGPGPAGPGGPGAATAEPEPAAAPRRPALSPSRANDFKQCPLLYRFRAIDRLPEVPSPAQVRGTLVHAVLERLFLLRAPERTPDAARALIAPAWAQLCTDDPRLPAAVGQGPGEADLPATAQANTDPASAAGPAGAQQAHGDPAPAAAAAGGAAAGVDAWLAGVEPFLDAYFALEDPRLLEPEARELLVEVELESGLLLRGYIDRVDRVAAAGSDGTGSDGTGPDRTGSDGTGCDGTALRVVDYKTGSAPRPVAEARALFQMKFYALALLRLRGVMPTELRLLYLTGPEELRYTPDEAQLRRFARTLDAIWSAIRTAGVTGDFRPNPGPSCTWCGYKSLCPAWDGVPPPYPGWPADSDPAADHSARVAAG